MKITYDDLTKRSRAIVRGTQDPSSGWYNSPDDLEYEIHNALHWAYWMGVRAVRDALAPFALRAAEQSAGASYRALPDRVWKQAMDAYFAAGGVLDEDAHRRIERAQASMTDPDFMEIDDA